jgi:hypothetical protein
MNTGRHDDLPRGFEMRLAAFFRSALEPFERAPTHK